MPKPDPLHIDLATLPLLPQRCKYVLGLILRRHNWSHSSKPKGVSHRTAQERARFCYWVFDFLRQCDPHAFKLDPRSFSGRHADALMAHWRGQAEKGQMAPATIQTYYSHLKTFTRWIGKPSLLKPLPAYFEPAMFSRSYCATADKSWRARGVDVASMIGEVEAYDTHAAAALWLMHAFGLRFKESVMLRPHVDVVTAHQAGKPDASAALFLDTHRGTKGGRRRFVPIEGELAIRAIDYAQRVALRHDDSVSDPALTLVKAIRRQRYVMERFGITRKDLGVVPHGLRHEFAADAYSGQTGVAPPVAGGVPVAKSIDHAARACVSELLGHGRPAIANVYLGSSADLCRSEGSGADAEGCA